MYALVQKGSWGAWLSFGFLLSLPCQHKVPLQMWLNKDSRVEMNITSKSEKSAKQRTIPP